MNARLYIATRVLQAFIARGSDAGPASQAAVRALTYADALLAEHKRTLPVPVARVDPPHRPGSGAGRELPPPRVQKQRAQAIREDVEKRGGGDAV